MFKFSKSGLASVQAAFSVCSTELLSALNHQPRLPVVKMHFPPRCPVFKRLCVLAATILKSFLSAPTVCKVP